MVNIIVSIDVKNKKSKIERMEQKNDNKKSGKHYWKNVPQNSGVLGQTLLSINKEFLSSTPITRKEG